MWFYYIICYEAGAVSSSDVIVDTLKMWPVHQFVISYVKKYQKVVHSSLIN